MNRQDAKTPRNAKSLHPSWRLGVLAVQIFSLFSASLQAAPSFDKDIKPIFDRRCSSCHGDEKQRGGLSLATLADLTKGGEDGVVIVVGKSADSMLVKLIEHRDKPFMPPEKEGPPLTLDEIKLIRAWIDAGAKNDGGPAPNKQSPTSRPASVAQTQPAQAAQAAPATSQPASKLAAQIGSLAFSPDGKLLAAGSLHVVELLNPADGSLVRRLEGHIENVRALAFTADGQLLAAAGGQPSLQGEVKIWKVADGSLVSTISGHKDCIYGVAWSPDGKQIATASYDKLVYVWEAATGKQVHEFKNHVDAVYAVRFTPDGRRLITVSADRSVKIWDAATGKHLYNLSESQGALYTVAISPAGKQIAAAGADQMIRVWEIGETSGKLIKSWFAHERPILRIAYTPDGSKICSTSEDKLLKIWDIAKQTELHVFEPQPDWNLSLAVAPQGNLLSVGRYDGSLAVYDGVSFQRVVNRAPSAAKPAEHASLQAGTPGADAKKDAPATSRPAKAEGEQQKKFEKVGDFIPVNAVQGAVTIPPSLTAINVRAAPVGATTKVVIYGQNLDGVSEVIVDDPGLRTKILEVKDLPRPKLNRVKFNTGAEIIDGVVPSQITMELAIGYEARAGFHEIRVRNARGTSTGIPFFVEDLSEVPEHEPNDDTAHAQLLTRGAVAVGAINQIGDVDYFKFNAKAGESYVFETVGTSLGSGLNGSLAVTRADGAVLAKSEDFGDSADARLAFQAPENGIFYISIADRQMMAGGFYRLRVADRAAITDVFPLGVQAGKEVELAVEGVGLHGVKTLKVSGAKDPAWGQETGIPADGRNGGVLTQLQLGVGEFPEVIETEPNDDVARPQAVTAPCTINGRIWHQDNSGDADVYKFTAKQGQPLVLDVTAQRIGSQLDSFIEILSDKGERIERATLRAVAKTMTVLADRDARMPNIRLENFDDFQVRDYLMIGNDLMRISRIPSYLDEDTLMYSSRGQRLSFLGTTPEHHAVNNDVYKVEINPPGARFAPNGMPVFHLYMQNDDGGPAYNKDSALMFDPPADGEYLVRIRSAESNSDRRYTYRLSIRPPRPEFNASVGPGDINISSGAGILVTTGVSRFDGFNGPVHVKLVDLPKGFTATESDILPGEENAFIVLSAAPNAESTSNGTEWRARLIATADINGKTVMRDARLRRLTLAQIKPDVEVALEPAVVQLEPGGSTAVTVHVIRNNGFAGRVEIEARNLPFGTDVANRGLNGILVTENETSRVFRINALPWASSMDRLITVTGQPATTGRANYLNAAPPIRLQIGPAHPRPSVVGKIAQK